MDEPDATSRSLLARVRSNEARAWDRLVELYAPLVMHWLHRSPVPRDDVQDVFQEVFQAAATHIVDFRKESARDTFRGWLRTIVRHKVVDHYRRSGREPRGIGGTDIQIEIEQVADPGEARTESESSATSMQAAAQTAAEPIVESVESEEAVAFAEGAGDGEGERELFRQALADVQQHFQQKTWKAFVRTVLDGQRPVDVATELEMSPGAVRVAKSRVLQRLRAELGDLMD